jgi:glycosyltransferase involved in cell wall biosynthesis
LKIYFDNIDFNSCSGPNSFGTKLASELEKNGHRINKDKDPDIQLSFIQAAQKLAPVVQRLDGIYFNSEQDWELLNKPIRQTYDLANGVVFQSEFNKTLTEKYFGKKEKSIVIHNGTDLEYISKIPELNDPVINKFDNVWSCASSWRPHKRLSENVRYFLEHSGDNDCLIIAGNNPDYQIKHNRVFYVGNLNYPQLISLYKKSKYFIHLALMDHCPNVVVDARSSGCKIVCSSSGGTKEIAGDHSVIIQDMSWDYLPFKLYDPPRMDFSKIETQVQNSIINIEKVSDMYLDFFRKILS